MYVVSGSCAIAVLLLRFFRTELKRRKLLGFKIEQLNPIVCTRKTT